MYAWCEDLAGSLLSDLGANALPICPRAIADACGLHLVPTTVPTGGRVCLVEDTIYYSRAVDERTQRAQIAHELGHWALDYYGELQSERAAWRIGAALLVPRRGFDRRRSVHTLAAVYQVPLLLVARRMVELSPRPRALQASAVLSLS